MTIRRDVLTALGLTALAPALVRAQAKKPVVGVLGLGVVDDGMFARELASFGWVDGRNVTLEWGAAQGGLDRLPQMAAALVARGVVATAPISGPAAVSRPG